MRSFLIAVVLAAAMGAGAYYVLTQDFQESSRVAFSTTGVRLSDVARR
ncbi:MAG: hypothetical protein IT556_12355 [Acetobacteraceae bacterium]|nr:hypothetical protein [Acetobacteraceae bacterium]